MTFNHFSIIYVSTSQSNAQQHIVHIKANNVTMFKNKGCKVILKLRPFLYFIHTFPPHTHDAKRETVSIDVC